MKITVNREKFLKALQKVSSIIGSRSMLPVLGNILLEANDNQLTLSSTDLEIRISTMLECSAEGEIVTTIPAKKCLALVSRFTGDNVDVTVDENHHIKLDCGTGHFTLLGLPGDDFPGQIEFAPVKTVRVKEGDFKNMLNAISYAVSPDDSRKVLTGVLLSTKGNIMTLVATDGKRLAMQEKMPEGIEGEDSECIIPLKAANEVKRIIDGNETLEIGIGNKLCSFKGANFLLTTKLIEGNYPNYRQVVPKEFSRIIEIPAEPLLAKIEMVAQVLSDSSSYIILSFSDNQLKIQGASSEVGEGIDSLEINYQGDPIDVSFNPVFLSDPLRVATSANVTIKINDPFNPVALEGKEGFLYVIMPIRKK